MDVREFVNCLENDLNVDFYSGVPDSQLKELCGYLLQRYAISDRHIIAANEGNCLGLAAGHYMATGKIPCVYMQNSGLGNLLNPYASLTNEKVYNIPAVFVVGWRGEPGIKDEPQHLFQGEITLELLELLKIKYVVLETEADLEVLGKTVVAFKEHLATGGSVAFVVRKGAFSFDGEVKYKNKNELLRETIIESIVQENSTDIFVSTTGKTSRELFEIRERRGEGHERDFLTVGSMGHSSMIALGIALEKKESRVWCLDGDGAALMHMGAMGIIGANRPDNLVHVVLNNSAHESVGGMPTICENLDLPKIAEACGYRHIFSAETVGELAQVIAAVKTLKGLVFIEVKTAIGSRKDLGRPTTTPVQNREAFMAHLKGCE